MTIEIAPARTGKTQASDPQYRLLADAVARMICDCGSADCLPYIRRGKLGVDSAPNGILLAMARRSFVRLDTKPGTAIVLGAWVTDLGVRKAREIAAANAERERVAAAVRGW